ncbi:phosphosugar isomerase [Salmonella enterica subsp. enterica]|uniref:Phosphosugar isomerase n=1 Tax=Salmonella enterica TaxID=28901 RepID=A0A7D8IQ37_SALER|nr:phosphosugar isomerase [Salmonella enterica]SUG68168.1 phosphosugar isomerase [Salmonella enterica subsp. enterica]
MSPTMLTYINEESDVLANIIRRHRQSLEEVSRFASQKNVTTNPDISHRIVIECRLLRPLFL